MSDYMVFILAVFYDNPNKLQVFHTHEFFTPGPARDPVKEAFWRRVGRKSCE